MGYTHYWYRKPSFDAARFSEAVRDCYKVCEALQIPLGDAHGEGKPSFKSDGIIFNGHVDSGSRQPHLASVGGLSWPTAKAEGVATIMQSDPEAGNWFAGPMLKGRALGENGDGSYETFAIVRDSDRQADLIGGLHFDCCKTNFAPYDLCVQCCLIVLSEHLGDSILVRSDGSDEQWNEARDVCQHVLGYGLLFQLAAESPASLPPEPEPVLPSIDRNEAIKRIREALKRRSGKSWSVTGGRGTAWGWISIKSSPRRMVDYEMPLDDCAELTKLLGVRVDTGGVSIPASSDYRWEYVDRAEGHEPRTTGSPYWD